MSKEREMYGIKVIVDNETYNEYKGTLEEQIEELQERIDKAIEYIENDKYWYITMKTGEELLKILKGDE